MGLAAALVTHGVRPPCNQTYSAGLGAPMTAVIGSEATDKRRGSVLGCGGGHADAAPHVDDEEQRAAELAETAAGDREPERGRG